MNDAINKTLSNTPLLIPVLYGVPIENTDLHIDLTGVAITAERPFPPVPVGEPDYLSGFASVSVYTTTASPSPPPYPPPPV